jgi:hypothetical protein
LKVFFVGLVGTALASPSPDICPLDGFRGQTNLAIDDHPTTSASVSILGDTTFNLRNGPVNKFYLHTRPSHEQASLYVWFAECKLLLSFFVGMIRHSLNCEQLFLPMPWNSHFSYTKKNLLGVGWERGQDS